MLCQKSCFLCSLGNPCFSEKKEKKSLGEPAPKPGIKKKLYVQIFPSQPECRGRRSTCSDVSAPHTLLLVGGGEGGGVGGSVNQ